MDTNNKFKRSEDKIYWLINWLKMRIMRKKIMKFQEKNKRIMKKLKRFNLK